MTSAILWNSFIASFECHIHATYSLLLDKPPSHPQCGRHSWTVPSAARLESPISADWKTERVNHGSGRTCNCCYPFGNCGLLVLSQLYKTLSQVEERARSSITETIFSVWKHGRLIHAEEIRLPSKNGCN